MFRAQTDLAPGVEVAALRLRGVDERGETRPLSQTVLAPEEDWASAPRALTPPLSSLLTSEVVAFDLIAVDELGREVLRDRRPRPRAPGIVDVRLVRSCIGVRCEGENACLGGRYVPLECRRGDEPSCPPPACRTRSDCLLEDARCDTESRCDAGVCFTRIDHRPCSGRKICALDRGCVAVPGLGEPDGARCSGNLECASQVCVENHCCERRCTRCERCDGGRCVVRQGVAGTTPRAETCDGLDEDCDRAVDEDVVVASEDHCGGCGLRCTSDERCVGSRCVLEDACAVHLGVPCEELEVATIHAPQPHLSGFAQSLAADGDLLVVAAPFDDLDPAGIDHAPLEPYFRAGDDDSGAVHVFVRDGDAWQVEAIVRLPADVPELERRGYRFGTWVALSGTSLAIAGSVDGTVRLYDRDADGHWSLTGAVEDPSTVLGLGYLEGGELVVLRSTGLQLIAPDGTQRTVLDLLTPRGLTIGGDRMAIRHGMRRIDVGTLDGGFEEVVSDVNPSGLAFAGEWLMLVDRPSLRGFRRGSEGWAEELDIAFPEGARFASGALLATDDWMILGAPTDRLSNARGVGADVRVRDGRGLQGTVYLYPRSASGAPIDAPLYLAPLEDVGARFFGLTLAVTDNLLFVSAMDRISSEGSVRIFRIAP